MAVDATQQMEFSSRVPKTEFDEFVGNFPMHGAQSWFIRSSLREFNKQCRENPAVIELIRRAISEMTLDPQ